MGFIHVPKRARSFLPFKIEEPLMARIDGDHLTIAAATKSQPEKARPRTRKPKVINIGGDTDYHLPTFFYSVDFQNTKRKSEILMSQPRLFRRLIWKDLNGARL